VQPYKHLVFHEIFIFTAKAQRKQRTIRLKGKELIMRGGLKIARDAISRRACIFNSLLLLAYRCFSAGLSRKLKKSFSAIFATRAKQAVNPCLNNNELISNRVLPEKNPASACDSLLRAHRL
jgi:hypothetical protein